MKLRGDIVLVAVILGFGTPLAQAQEPGTEPSPEAAGTPAEEPAPEAKAAAPEAGPDEAAVPAPAPKAGKLQAVVRGFHMGLQGGIGFMPMTVDDRSYLPGGDFGVHMGYDIIKLLSLQISLFWSTFGVVKSEASPDLMMFGGRLALLFTLWSTQRTFIQAGPGVGIAWFDNGLTTPFTRVILADVLFGVEYHTKLRHFSVGLDLDVQFLFMEKFNLNLQLLPHVRYSF